MNNHDSQKTVPRHIGFIMDGNRRWATERGLAAFRGHEAGVDALERVADACFDAGVQYMTAYTFSIENWSRTKEEVNFLMGLVTKILTKYVKKFNQKGIRIEIIGTREKLSKKVIAAIESAEESTKTNTRGTLALCFNYGGRQEIVDTLRNIVSSGVDIATITAENVVDYLYKPHIPPCDLIVRTSGENRLSGFMMPRSEYAELVFDTKYWPDLDARDVSGYIAEFTSRTRRFGK
jgi:undecaprenyl diphosphate synthase